MGIKKTKKEGKPTFGPFWLEDLTFHQKVYDGYMEVVDRFKERIICIDASKSIEEVKNNVMDLIEDHLKWKQLSK